MWQDIVNASANLIVETLKFLTDKITGNHGWSILILTLLFRVLILPLTMKSLKSMKAMAGLQPKMKEIQEKYKDDKDRQSREMMALYKEAGANPFTGCLPMLLQMPIFIILFQVLRYPERNGYLLVNSSFYGMDLTTAAITKLPTHMFGGITLAFPGMIDLSFTNFGFLHNTYFYLPTTILVVLMVVTTFLQQQGMTMDPKQKPTMYMMNVFIVYISLMMPSGVLMYWVFSNFFQIVQQKIMGPVAKPALAGAAANSASGGPGGMKKKASQGTKPVAPPPESRMLEPEKSIEPKPAAPKPAVQTGSLKKNTGPKKPQTASKKSKKKKKR